MADRPQIFEFIRRAYPEKWRYKIPERWEWEFRANPFLKPDELPIWIAVTPDGQVVGQSCALIEPLRLGNTIGRVGWSVDTYMLPDFRGQGLGYQLQQANDAAHEVFMSLSMSAANRRIKAALGSIPIQPVTEYVKTLRHEPEGALAAVLGGGKGKRTDRLGLGRALASLLTIRRAMLDMRLLRAASKEIQISPAPEFDAAVDDLVEQLGQRFNAMVIRNHQYLNWKYVRQPHLNYTRYLAYRGSALCGYVIVRQAEPPEPNIGILADLVCLPKDRTALHALLAAVLAHFRRTEVSVIKAATTAPEYAAALDQFGFRKAGEVSPMFHCRSSRLDCAAAVQPDSWLLSKADHDWDQYPNA